MIHPHGWFISLVCPISHGRRERITPFRWIFGKGHPAGPYLNSFFFNTEFLSKKYIHNPSSSNQRVSHCIVPRIDPPNKSCFTKKRESQTYLREVGWLKMLSPNNRSLATYKILGNGFISPHEEVAHRLLPQRKKDADPASMSTRARQFLSSNQNLLFQGLIR